MLSPNVPIIIDVEASGFGPESYPIEVGLADSDGKRYCRLIKPHMDWQHWDPQAQALHGISLELLQNKGLDPSQVCLELNQLLAGQTVYTDGWVVDHPWMIKLFEYAGMEAQFHISPLDLILNEQQMDSWHSTKESLFLKCQEARHRASNDAALIQQTYLHTKQEYLRSIPTKKSEE